MKLGRETGEELGSYIDEGINYAKSKFEEGKSKANSLADDVHAKAEETSRKAETVKNKYA